MFLQFETPVNGRGIVMGGNEGTPGFPLIGRDVSSPLSHPVGNSHEPQHTSSALPSPEALANEIVNQMGDVIQHVTQKIVQSIITQLSPSVSNPSTNAFTSPTNADSVDHDSESPSCDSDDLESLYESLCSFAPS
ncbi:unnamed protein product [Arctogadus glacialis]